MRALVTGCAGFIGSHLTESLLADGIEVIGVDCFNDNYGRQVKLRNIERAREWNSYDFVPVDLSRGALSDLVEGCETVFHLAAEPGVRASWGSRFETYVRNNVLATQHVLEAARQTDGVRVVYASSSSVYGHAGAYPTDESVVPRPYSPYGVTKLSGEHLTQLYAENLGLKTVALRYFSVYGPRQRPDMAFTRFCRAALTGDEITVYGDGEQVRDFTYVDDVVRATRAAGDSDGAVGNIFNVGGGSQVTVKDTLRLLGEMSGKELNVRHTPAEQGDVRRTSADVRRAMEGLNFTAQVEVPDGLARQFEWARGELDAERPATAPSATG